MNNTIVPKLLAIEDYISLKLRVEVADGRELQGILVSVDDQANILMTDVTEEFHDQITSEWKQRQIGLVSVPRKTIKKVKIDLSDYNKTLKWKMALDAKNYS